LEKNDFRTELNPFEMLEELLWQDQFELIFPEKSDNENCGAQEKGEADRAENKRDCN
jgi:hypothetical protein